MKRTFVHAALVGSLAFAGMGAAMPALAAPGGAADTAIQKSPAVKKVEANFSDKELKIMACLLYTSPSPRD